MPKISVIIPVYNSEKYLKNCLEVLLKQTLSDLEIICINDCSTDNSLKILKDYQKIDKRIKIIDSDKNYGAGAAKNAGLKIASGNYLSFLDPDDVIDNNYYEELYNKANETKADIVKCNLIIIDTNGRRKMSNLNTLIKTRSKFYFSFEYTSAIYKSSLIFDNNITFPVDLTVGEDDVFLNKSIIKAKTIEITDRVNYYYIRRDNSLNAESFDEKRINSAIKAIEYMAENFDNALSVDISKETYLEYYLANILTLIEFTLTKTDIKDLKIKCIKKFIELFNKCKYLEELEKFFTENYKQFLYYIKNNDTDNILEIFIKYKNFQNYCMLEKLRNKVNKDFTNEKSIGSNTCI